MANQNPLSTVGFLLSDSARMLRRIFNMRVAPMDLTQAQWRGLAYLARNEGLNQVSLADLMEVQPITVARLIDKLVAAGLVERRPDPKDRRAQLLFLTERATPLLIKMSEFGETTNAIALSGFSAEETETLLNLLSRIRANLATLVPGSLGVVSSQMNRAKYSQDNNANGESAQIR
jgi:MarR family transcriptional regulator for hemolysin